MVRRQPYLLEEVHPHLEEVPLVRRQPYRLEEVHQVLVPCHLLEEVPLVHLVLVPYLLEEGHHQKLNQRFDQQRQKHPSDSYHCQLPYRNLLERHWPLCQPYRLERPFLS